MCHSKMTITLHQTSTDNDDGGDDHETEWYTDDVVERDEITCIETT